MGYTGTSTRTIAEAVGIRQASLYHYFKTKDDILCALLSQTVTPTWRSSRACSAPSRRSARRTPPCVGGIRRHAVAQRPLESRRAVSAARTAGAGLEAVLVGPRTAATALPGVSQAIVADDRGRRGRRRSAVSVGRVVGQHVGRTAGPTTAGELPITWRMRAFGCSACRRARRTHRAPGVSSNSAASTCGPPRCRRRTPSGRRRP